MREYRGPDGRQRLWFDPGEIDRIMEAELRKASLHPKADAPAVDIERFIERHLKVGLDQYADLEPSILGLTEFVSGKSPKISINRVLTGSALDEDETQPGVLGRWRATLAHEAAHVLLHRCLYEFATGNMSLFGDNDVPSADARTLHRCLKRDVSYRQVSDWREVQANQGMAALLMPRTVFLQVARGEIHRLYPKGAITDGEEDGVAAALASRFEVSRQAARIRLNTLGLVSPQGQGRLE
ncbi:ImmA/IrrE family metallo-endopeptidase [Sorangium sp. So ce118]